MAPAPPVRPRAETSVSPAFRSGSTRNEHEQEHEHEPEAEDLTPSAERLNARTPERLSLDEIVRGPASRRRVALTFDAGSGAAPTAAILRALAAADRRCTFFLTGEWTARHPDLARRIAAAGHELGNHTYSHPDLRRLSNAAVAQELERTDALVRRLTGRSTRPYFRPPFGSRDRRILREAARRGYRSVYWTTDSLDSVRRGITPRQVERRVLDQVQPGGIVLLHCGSEATARALPRLLTALDRRGYRVVTVSELLRGG